MSEIIQENRPLLVLNASAGSGKTYRLVLEYLMLLFESSPGSRRYRHLVAMTFTNKAAFEMKERILIALHEIASFDSEKDKPNALMNTIESRTNVKIGEQSKKAQAILAEILHGYEDFLISTIDKFNLRLIRSFGRDLNLPQEFEVVLNEGDILEKVIDSILAKVGIDGNEKLTQLITNYTKKNLDEEINWNFKKQLLDFCSILSKERYIDIVDKLLSQSFEESDLNAAKMTQDDLFKILCQKGKAVAKLFAESGLRDDQIYNKSKTSKPLNSLKDINTWPNEHVVAKAIITGINDGKFDGVFSTELLEAIQDLKSFHAEYTETYIKLSYYRETFYNLALLQYVAKEMDAIREEEKFIRISEFNKLISGLVRNQHAPYIYERLGNRLHHFMLDEFQDTSRMQWLNLIPLLEESISKGNKNLIVGDAKQSIYRFNNGLAEQFVSLPRIYNPEQNAIIEAQSNFFEQMGTLEEMENNFRSGSEIVSFNNDLFESFKAVIPQDSQSFYKSVHQYAIQPFKGYVEAISGFEKNLDIDVYENILAIIERCLADGFLAGDICILNEKNEQGNRIAQYLTQHKYKVVSADSLLIHSDVRIRLTITYLNLRNRTSNQKEFMKFADLYLRFTSSQPEMDYLSLFDLAPSGRRFFNSEKFIAKHFGDESKFYMPYTNLYDLVQKFYALMAWQETQDVYLHHFADICYTFQVGRKIDLNSFLEYYKKNQGKLAIQSPKTNDAIQIMTIHKSKGLQFPVVIIPNLDFKLDTSSSFLIQGDDQVYYRRLNANSPLSLIREFSAHEKNQNFMDKLNLLYVGLTRPIHRLYLFNSYEGAKKIGKVLHEQLSSCFSSSVTNEILRLQLGEEIPVELPRKTDSFYTPEEFGERLWYPNLVVRQDFDNEQTLLGKAFHTIMANCSKINEVENNIQALINRSELYESQRDTLVKMVTHVFTDSQYLSWVENAEKIYNESWIIDEDGSLLRPDKVIEMPDIVYVIDFKTGLEASKHVSQINQYISRLKLMFNKPIKGYLYYSQTGAWGAC